MTGTKKKYTPGITAKEFMDQLEADPDWVRRREERDRELAARQAELRKAEEPVIEDLRKVGIEVNRIWDLLSFERPYSQAFPILLEHLRKPHRGEVLEDLGRVLGAPEARVLWPTLVEIYETTPSPDARMGLSAALSKIALRDKTLLDDVIRLIRNPQYGEGRGLLIDVLTRSREPRARETLYALRDDPDLNPEISDRLERLEKNAKRRAKRRRQDLH